MDEIVKELQKQLDWPNVIKSSFIPKGFSFDEKYKIELENGDVYFIKVCDFSTNKHKQEEFEYIRHFEWSGIPVPIPFHFLNLAEFNKCVQVYGWVNGEDGEVALGKLTIEEQYKAGKAAGEVLKRIHTLEKNDVKESWETYRWAKYERYLTQLMEYEVDYIDLDPVLTFVEDHKYLLKDRPIVFLHDDFHPANMMFHNKEFQAVIDFDRFGFGDPIHDFYKVALFTTKISAPFAIGQVHGYFDGEPSLHFWKLYTLYAAMTFPSDIVWSHKVTPDLLDRMKERLNRIFDDHDGFTSYIPGWYKSIDEYRIHI
ncbi:aminoglycoside phosphotransferase family protein [Bacillus sp. DX1.1]|uniref:aminoglycoside phosphotransferase family protein n=1 Tax=unclassified Bacillus (in: firmicutes) TaxID=185979 RepID=UPI0025710C4A|nr:MULTISPECIES: aminoglycoside phosphotransferase family protein [unclassified Bacillus (in: firmicutes)]MDM5155360.1 aminoglycoside phosphotransferase family protein [Bacillus sp. DX1.1]WJE84102.1 aminoglycoside phosphotransferase family protein [Bacillus sp. DX3.1]